MQDSTVKLHLGESNDDNESNESNESNRRGMSPRKIDAPKNSPTQNPIMDVNTEHRQFPDGFQALYLQDPNGVVQAQVSTTLTLLNQSRVENPQGFMHTLSGCNPYSSKFPQFQVEQIRIRPTEKELHCSVSACPSDTSLHLGELMIYPSEPKLLDSGETRVGWITVQVTSSNVVVPNGHPHVTIGYITQV
eukprot:m.62531 g.62531  ORF g.62531 m.62531 type:complete len:191 (+) comp23169_c0_seq1:120-692(+)